MPDTPGNPNQFAEGFHGIDYVSNMGFTFGTPEFPDSLGADHLGGAHALYFSGIDWWNNPVLTNLSYGWSGIIGPYTEIVDAGFPGKGIYPFSAANRWFYNPSGLGYPLSDLYWPENYVFSGATRIHWDTRGAQEGGPDHFEGMYNSGLPNLRNNYEITNKVGFDEYYNIKNTGGMEDVSIYVVQNVNIIDLISEGPIEGFITGSYSYNISGKNPGDIGYTSVTFAPFNTGAPGITTDLDPTLLVPPEARSIYWNDTPVASNEGYLNFRFAEFRYDYGTPNSHTVSNPRINLYEDRYHYDGYQVDQYKYPAITSTTLPLGERLYGPSFYSGIVSGLAPWKRYYVYNTEVEAIKLNIRINSLYASIISGNNYGAVLPDQILFAVRLWRVFSDRKETIASSKRVVLNPTEWTEDKFYVKGKIQGGPTLCHYTFWIRPQAENGFFIELLPDQIGWAFEIVKLTEEFNQSARKNETYVDSITYLTPDRYTYPSTAMVYNNFNAKYFSQIPTRKYKMRLLKVKVPINYDPISKNYSGAWNGQFKLAWTDNPAWCLYDLITNNRFGLGKYINSSLVDKWSLYEISQYCDQLVPDGYGGLEPRFTCNVLISAKEEAYKVINDMASIFNGLVYYSAGEIFTSQDRPKEPIYIFNNSNVIDGNFIYSSSSKRARRSIALIRFNDEYNNYQPAVEYVEDRSALLKYGIREVEITAFGATKRSQARRLGRWFLTSENLETETVTFDVGLEGSLLRPGDIINIYDSNRKTQNFAGRTLSLNTGSAILDIQYNSLNVFGLTGVVNPITLKFLTPTYNLNPGTYLGDLYMTGFDQTSSGVTGLNSDFFRKSQIQSMSITNPKNYISSGTGAYSNYVRVTFPSGLSTGAFILPQNTVWTIEYNPELYSGLSLGLDNRFGMNNPNNLLYPGYYLEGYLNDLAGYRITNINQKDENAYTITALEYVPQKYTDIVTGESLISVPTKIPAPNDPSLSLRILYRDPQGNYGVGQTPYTINKTGINSIAYKIIPPTNSGVVTSYYIYRKFGSNFSPLDRNDSNLFDVQSTPLRNQDLALPLTDTTGNVPSFFTPTGTGTWYVGLYATNAYNERSSFVSSSITLNNQASLAVVLASGFNVVGSISE